MALRAHFAAPTHAAVPIFTRPGAPTCPAIQNFLHSLFQIHHPLASLLHLAFCISPAPPAAPASSTRQQRAHVLADITFRGVLPNDRGCLPIRRW